MLQVFPAKNQPSFLLVAEEVVTGNRGPLLAFCIPLFCFILHSVVFIPPSAVLYT
jgi:hypothetical protein